MLAAPGTLPQRVESAYASGENDVDFSRLLSGAGTAQNDEALAELIELDGRIRISLGRSVDLERYLGAVLNLRQRPVPLDAAIDVALRALSGTGQPTEEAVHQLTERYPALAIPIREASLLGAAVWSTNGIRRQFEAASPRRLPCEFGPVLPSGQRRYELKRLLGTGAWGEVFLANDRQLAESGHEAHVAIKVLHATARDAWSRRRLVDEATKARRVVHPNVVRVLDRGVSDQDEDYIVYEYVDGGDLADWLRRRPNLSPREAARLIARISRGMQAAHSAGLVHCDLKPGNILMTSDDEPKVGDFGIAVRTDESAAIARADQGGRPLGNLAFISPEQFRAEDGSLSIPSDIYALGGILYFALTRRLPNGSTEEEIARNHDAVAGRRSPPDPRDARRDLEDDLASICMRAMAARPSDRHAAAANIADDLESWARREPIEWTFPSAPRLAWLWIRRHPALAGAVAAALAATALGAAGTLHFARQARESRAAAIDAQQTLDAVGEELSIRYEFVEASLERASEETIGLIHAYETLIGQSVLATPGLKARLWQDRIRFAAAVVARNHAQGKSDHLETLFWESALGFWLVCDDRPEEATPILERNAAAWSARLSPGDAWLTHLDFVRICAEAGVLLKTMRAAPPDDSTRARAADLALGLRQWRTAFPAGVASPVCLLAVRTLLALDGPELLADDVEAAELRQLLEDAGHAGDAPGLPSE